MRKIDIAVIPGDGIGREVVPESLRILDLLSEIHGGFKFEKKLYPYSCDYYEEHGKMMPDDGFQQLSQHDAIFLGAIGDPKRVPDHIALWQTVIGLRREFQQVINLRPVKSLKGITSPLRGDKNFDFIVVRENSEGEYSQVGGTIHQDNDEIAIQTNVFTRKATEGVIDFAFQLANDRNHKLTSATKSNGLYHSMPFWNRVFTETEAKYEDIETELIHIDALSAFFVTKPESFDVIVASNLFGDILSDLGGAIMGSIGIAPSANINLNGKYPSMFEPVHGSAPDIYGKNIANPIGQLWTAKLMLEHFGYEEIGNLLLNTIEELLVDNVKTPDLGGNYGTTEFIDALFEKLKKQ
ncbi:tartrate dehydrogenase [Lysinibacillus telephonicus]|uniref:D-malate dehydrogenase (decarboxylating) n=1 Tax=Lysinibacillus telephonicus TaxID=1714840 RepID=A0A3S0HLZ3_9BACI|nr:tartrate dehydrogenase [Lysinibacillus telephonicus]RTQ92664.1 tartrate dehydrogenase [Lysinibacillus telephonicus]